MAITVWNPKCFHTYHLYAAGFTFKDDHNNISHLTGSSTMWPYHTHQKVSLIHAYHMESWTRSMMESTRSDTESFQNQVLQSNAASTLPFCLNLALVLHTLHNKIDYSSVPPMKPHVVAGASGLKWTNLGHQPIWAFRWWYLSQHLTTSAWVTSRKNYPDESCPHKYWAQ